MNFKTIQAKLMGAFALLALVAAGIGIFELSELSESNQRIRMVVKLTAPRIAVANDVLVDLLNYVRLQGYMVIAPTEADRQIFIGFQRDNLAKYNNALARWEPIATDETKKALPSMQENMSALQRLNDQLIALCQAGKFAEAQTLSVSESRRTYDLTRVPVLTAISNANKAMEEQAKESEERYISMRWSIWLVMTAGIGLSLCAGWFVTRQTMERLHNLRDHLKDVAEGDGDLTKHIAVTHQDEVGELGTWLNKFLLKLQQMVAEIVSSTDNIAAASHELAANATEMTRSANSQRQEILGVATAMQEMAATVVEVSNNSNQAAETAKKSEAMARTGGDTVRGTVDTIRVLAADTRDTSQKILELGKASDQIGKIIGVIDDIADQTNLLALNAAIEAARAGEQGRGFAVVADEVRKLAERTSQATKEITTMVNTIQSETKQAVDAMNNSSLQVEIGVKNALEAGAALDKIIEGASQVQTIIVQIATAAHEQSSTTDQVTLNMDQIARMVEQSAAGAEESGRAVHDLSDQARHLQSLVGQFKVDEHKASSEHRFEGRVPEFSEEEYPRYQ
jgi:methyl-accepting chemotaxis protein